MNLHDAMKHRALTLGLACLTALALLAPAPARAQALKLPSGSSAGAPSLASPAATPSLVSPAAAAPGLTSPAATPPADAAAAGVRQADYIVAVVNSEPITNNEVRLHANRVAREIASQNGSMPPRERLLKEALERLIVQKIQVQLAKENGIKVDDYAVDQAEASVAQQNQLTIPEMHRRMLADGISVANFREELREQLLALRVRERDVESRVHVSDLEVDQYLRDQQKAASANPAAGADKLQLNLGHILIRVPENASPEQVEQLKARAQEALTKAKSGAEFSAVAREYSDAPEASSGGVMGLRPADHYPELFVNAARQAGVGSVLGPLRSPAGFHILKVIDKSFDGLSTTVTQTHARHILLQTNAGLTEREAAARLEDLRERVVSGHADFAALAREYSQDGSAQEGGDLGWASPGRFVPEFEQALNALAPGEISHPVVTRFGVHLIQLLERRQTHLTAREQREMVRNVVRDKKLDEAYANWIQEARGRAYVEYRDAPS